MPAKGGDARDASHGGWMDQGRSPGFLQLSEVDRAGVASLIGFLKQQENWQMTLEPGMNQAHLDILACSVRCFDTNPG